MRFCTTLFLFAAAALAQENLDFERGLDGWTIENGARTTGTAGTCTPKVVDGALHFRGEPDFVAWNMAMRGAPCAGGQRVLLQVAAKCKNLRRERRQYPNANGVLVFNDAKGKRLGIVTTPIVLDDRDWVDLHVHAIAPPGTTSVRFGVFASMSGDCWFDDVRLTVRDADDRTFALEALRLHLDRTYPFWDLPGKPKPKDLIVDPSLDIVAGAQKMLAPLKDVHVTIKTPKGFVGTFQATPPVRNWNAAAIQERVTRLLHSGDGHLVAQMGTVGYIALGNFTKGLDRVQDAIDKLLPVARVVVIDLRWNSGGDENLAWPIARRFLKTEVRYSSVQVRDPSRAGLTGFGPPAARTIGPLPKPYTRRVVVLQGPWCMSSTEGFLLVMRAAGHQTVGMRTRGASANPRPFPLIDGVEAWTSTWRQMDLTGKGIEGVGIAPAVEVSGSHLKRDPTLEKALELIR